MTRDELIRALQEAPAGSRLLSDSILLALGWAADVEKHTANGEFVWYAPRGTAEVPASQRPCPTTSLDAAESLWARGTPGEKGSRWLNYCLTMIGTDHEWVVSAVEKKKYGFADAAKGLHKDKILAAVLAALEAEDDPR